MHPTPQQSSSFLALSPSSLHGAVMSPPLPLALRYECILTVSAWVHLLKPTAEKEECKNAECISFVKSPLPACLSRQKKILSEYGVIFVLAERVGWGGVGCMRRSPVMQTMDTASVR